MPKSKPDKKVSLTKTTKKGLKAKQQLVEEIRKCVGVYKNIFVFSVDNMRNGKLKELRGNWKESRFFFGKNKVMTLGLGKKREDEVEENLHQLSSELKGQCGLLFTNKSKNYVIKYFENFTETDFARAGFVATESVELKEGPLEEFPHSIEPHLRQLGLPTALKKGVIVLLSDHQVCRKGDPLTPEQARILKLLGKQMAQFKLTLLCCWRKKNGKFETLKTVSSEDMVVEEEEEEACDTEMVDV